MASKDLSNWERPKKRRTDSDPMKSRGGTMNAKRDYYRRPNRAIVYIVAHRRNHKALSKAIEHDFGFTTNGRIDIRRWDIRGIRLVPSYKKGLAEWFRKTSSTQLGCVFIVCGLRSQRAASYVDSNRHLKLFVPAINNSAWFKHGVFKKAAEYLNIDTNIFRPD